MKDLIRARKRIFFSRPDHIDNCVLGYFRHSMFYNIKAFHVLKYSAFHVLKYSGIRVLGYSGILVLGYSGHSVF